jgi:hypothetical protein
MNLATAPGKRIHRVETEFPVTNLDLPVRRRAPVKNLLFLAPFGYDIPTRLLAIVRSFEAPPWQFP